MSANFSLSGNSQFDNDSLKSSCNVGAVISKLNLSILGGIFSEGVAFLGFIVLISFLISDTLIAYLTDAQSFSTATVLLFYHYCTHQSNLADRSPQ